MERLFSTQVFLLMVSVDARMKVSSLFHLMGDLVMSDHLIFEGEPASVTLVRFKGLVAFKEFPGGLKME